MRRPLNLCGWEGKVIEQSTSDIMGGVRKRSLGDAAYLCLSYSFQWGQVGEEERSAVVRSCTAVILLCLLSGVLCVLLMFVEWTVAFSYLICVVVMLGLFLHSYCCWGFLLLFFLMCCLFFLVYFDFVADISFVKIIGWVYISFSFSLVILTVYDLEFLFYSELHQIC